MKGVTVSVVGDNVVGDVGVYCYLMMERMMGLFFH